MLDREITDSNEEQLLISSAVEFRLTALIQQGDIQALISSRLPPQILTILDRAASNSKDPSLITIAKFITNSIAPIELVR